MEDSDEIDKIYACTRMKIFGRCALFDCFLYIKYDETVSK